MSSSPLHKVVIAGAFNSRQARALEGETSQSITLEAALGALAPHIALAPQHHLLTAGIG